MTSDDLNRLVRQGFEQAEKLESDLQDLFADLYVRAGMRAADRFWETATIVASGDWSNNEPSFDDQTTRDEAAADTLPLFERMMEAAVEPLTQGEDFTFDIGSDSARSLLDSMSGITDQVAVGVKDPVRSALAQAWNEGMSAADAALALEDAVTTFSSTEASLLARTSMNAISNGASQIAVQQLNARAADQGQPVFGRKRWLTAHDLHVRPTHADADGQTVLMHQPFLVGGARLQFPGDPSGPADQILHCRCVLLYEEATDLPPSTLPFAQEVPMTTFETSPTSTVIPLPSNSGGSYSVTVTVTDNITGTESDEHAGEASDMNRVSWQGTLAVEGHPTDDGRYLIPGGITNRDLPLTLMAMTGNGPGHDGAMAAGSIERIWREDAPDISENAVRVMGSGYFDSGEFGQEIARMVDEDTLNGVSVDLAIEEVVMLDRATYEEVDQDTVDFIDLISNVYLYGVKSAKIMAATICAMPAFAEADDIALVASGEPCVLRLYSRLHPTVIGWRDGLTDALVASAAPLKPPASAFDRPNFKQLTPLTYTDDGRVYGHLAGWDTCHTSYMDRCVTPPRSQSDYAFFHTGVIETDDGQFIPIGRISLGTNHANIQLDAANARSHYDHTGTVGAFVRAGEDKFGPWLVGVVRHDLPEAALRDMMANPPSGDWRRRELVGVLCVPSPGYPVPRQVLLADGGPLEDMEVQTLIAGLDEFGAIAGKSTAVKEGAWDADANVGRIPDDAPGSTLRAMYAWVDPDGDPTAKSSYKFPHHFTGSDGSVGAASINGVNNALARLPGSSIPAGDKAGVRAHLERHQNARKGESSMSGVEFEASIEALSDLAGV